MSIAVGTTRSTKSIRNIIALMGCNMNNMVVRTVKFESGKDRYPVNELRNAALAGVQTSHAVMLDADFMPSSTLHDDLKKHRQALTDAKQAIVIPAFESPLSARNARERSKFPQTKQQLLHHFGYPRNSLAQFAFDYQWNAGGHNTTNYALWGAQKGPSSLTPIKCLQSPRYEPYLVVRYCQDLPPFQESFVGYGKNKITWMRHFLRLGYRLSQLNGEGFAIHAFHWHSTDKTKWLESRERVGQKNMDVEKIAQQFNAWLERKVPDQTVVPVCWS